jgi:hypothetical protein
VGYDVYFTIDLEASESDKNKFINYCEQHLEEPITENSGYYYSDILDFYNCDCENTKWYNCEKEMQELSRKWPTIRFTVNAEGEYGDQWKVKTWGGNVKVVGSHVVFDEFSWDEIAPLSEKLEIVLDESSKIEE